MDVDQMYLADAWAAKDHERRSAALSQAAHDMRGQSSAQEVVARAEVYHAFLLGKTDS